MSPVKYLGPPTLQVGRGNDSWNCKRTSQSCSKIRVWDIALKGLDLFRTDSGI